MLWDSLTGLFSGNNTNRFTSIYDDKVPPPPSGGAMVPPPNPPLGYKRKTDKETETLTFKGFTPPPKINVDTNYESDDYSNYVVDNNSSDLYKKPGELINRIFKTQRANNCFESIKMGWKMGGAVGGIFGTITGLYTSVRHRNLMILPISTIGGAISFGFFLGTLPNSDSHNLGCGMIVRC